jgi:hypothetical protein
MPITSNNVDAFLQNALDPSSFDFTYGTGLSGSATISGTTTLTTEAHYTDLTIANTGILKPAGFRIFVSGTLTIDAGGTINDDGSNASGGTAGGALAIRGYLSGAATPGGTGVVTTANGAAAASLTNGTLNNSFQLPQGGAGGAAGARTGGSGGVVSTQPGHISTSWPSGRITSNGFAGGSGGGSGAGDVTAGGTVASGGGGGGGGAVFISAKNIGNNGRISANGGNGGNAVTTGAGIGGGGGGGGGGYVIIFTKTTGSLGTVQVNGGNPGTGSNGGNAGITGTSGSTFIVRLV